jgi:hypothetical protein
VTWRSTKAISFITCVLRDYNKDAMVVSSQTLPFHMSNSIGISTTIKRQCNRN